MTGKQYVPEFNSYEDALAWMTAEVDDPYQDNVRFAYDDDVDACGVYDEQVADGCCGYFDQTVIVAGRRARIGCNFGH